VPPESKVEVKREESKLAPEQETALKKAYHIVVSKEEENRKIKEVWENLEKAKAKEKAQEVKTEARKKSPESTSSEPQKKGGNRKSTKEARVKVFRLISALGAEVISSSSDRKEVKLTPAQVAKRQKDVQFSQRGGRM
jgi:hypothetical protein